MITPKEKAIELVEKFTLFLGTDNSGNEYYVEELDAKMSALICVGEILTVGFLDTNDLYDYWAEVKQEINKL